MSLIKDLHGHYFNESKILTNTEKSASRKQTGQVKMSASATGLTSQACLIHVVKYLTRIGFEKTVSRNIPHQRSNNAGYQLTDVMLFTILAMIGGATSIAKLCTPISALQKVRVHYVFPVLTNTLSHKHMDTSRLIAKRLGHNRFR
ncbi:MAG: hypothetical protein ACXV79_09255 [Methylobacter sp.]